MECDAIVVGLGPGGEEVAGKLAQAGLNVVGIEAELLGGECPYWGCIPSKMMVRAADLLAEGRRIPGNAGSSQIVPDWAPVATRIRDEATDTWDDKVAVDRYVGKGGHFIRGRARVTSVTSVEVNGEEISAKRALVLATGARPFIPPMFEDIPHWTNRDAIAAETVPDSLVIIGGGAIGLEIGQVMARFGARVTIIEMGDRLAGPEEPEVSELITGILEREGLTVHTGVPIERVTSDAAGCTVVLTDGTSVTAEKLLVATGRRSDLEGLGVAALGLDASAKALPVDGRMRVMPGVWSVGDITGKGAFTHVAMYQARICVADILGQPIGEADYRALPRVTFTDPEIGSVGMTEAAARQAGGTVNVFHEPIGDSARGWIHKAEGLVKLVEQDGVLVGATSMAPSGGEILGMLTLAVHARIPVSTLKDMIYAYPTFHRAIDSALWSEPKI
ncbi:MAG TPA: NAD(P)/FAD-dependent oxidoreductase [Acidimicrobiales bacterium]|nr:NAD(P)/FAD-dependent oxidoreductase [Acidimicrobiales bacterium]